MTGYSKAELLRKNYRDFFPTELNKKIFKIFNHVYITGNPLEINDYQIIRKNGKKLYFEASVFLSRDASSRPTGFQGIFRDVTDRKILEFQLYQSQKMESIGILASGFVHDFNNLLTTIQGRLSLLLLDMQKTDGLSLLIKKLLEIEQDIFRATELSTNLLGFARKEKSELKPTDICLLVKSQTRMFVRTRKDITIHEYASANPLMIEADEGQIGQVLLNIFINAAHAMPKGGDLTIRTESISLSKNEAAPHNALPGAYVKISITDTGIGMSEKIRIRIFEPFFTTKGKAGGTGLGLSAALSIIKNHRGFITVYSEKDNGSTFNIYLPQSRKNLLNERNAKAPAERIIKGDGTILLVDDEEMVAIVVAEMLVELGL